MQIDIMRLTVRQLLTRGRLFVLVLIALVPPSLAFLYSFSASRTDPQSFLVGLLDNLVFVVVVPVIALTFAAAALGSEIEDGTIVYLLLKPVARWRIAVSKFVVAAAIIAVFVVVCMVVTALALDRSGAELAVGYAFALAAVLGGAAYAAVFCFLGLVTSRALIAGLLYVFIWEGVVTRLFAGARNLSIREYMRGLADAASTLPTAVFDAPLSGARALTGCLIVIALFTFLAAARLRSLNLNG